ncbi:MAG TPA: hypothetical protein VFU05_08815 [Cyclobacteriaceae bacterium]|nr:hypothetical protein [Cyclobacteriaceae bacterium]
MKAIAKVYKGIEFINVNDLPTNQQLLLEHNAEVERIKILLDGKVVSNCIQFREYEQWYTTVYKRSVHTPTPAKETIFKLNVSLSKV